MRSNNSVSTLTNIDSYKAAYNTKNQKNPAVQVSETLSQPTNNQFVPVPQKGLSQNANFKGRLLLPGGPYCLSHVRPYITQPPAVSDSIT